MGHAEERHAPRDGPQLAALPKRQHVSFWMQKYTRCSPGRSLLSLSMKHNVQMLIAPEQSTNFGALLGDQLKSSVTWPRYLVGLYRDVDFADFATDIRVELATTACRRAWRDASILSFQWGARTIGGASLRQTTVRFDQRTSIDQPLSSTEDRSQREFASQVLIIAALVPGSGECASP